MVGFFDAFVLADGTLSCDFQDAQHWFGWSPDESAPPSMTAVTAAMGPTGNLEAFAIADDGVLYYNYLSQGVGWKGWTSPPGANCPSGVTAVSALIGVAVWSPNNSNPGNLHVFAIADGSLYFANLDLQGNWSDWEGDFDGAPPNVTTVTGSMGPAGHFEAFAVASGVLYHNWEGGLGWNGSWVGPFDTNCPSNVTTVTAAMGPNGFTLQVFAVADGILYNDWQDEGGNWAGWTGSFDGSPSNVSTVTAALGASGNLEVFAVADGTLYHNWEDGSGNWHGWTGPFDTACPTNVTAAFGAMGPWPGVPPTPAQTKRVQQSLKNMQAFNDHLWLYGQSKVTNAYFLLSEQDNSDPGLAVGLNIFEGVFWGFGSEGGPIGNFVASFLSGMLSWWATDNAPPSLNTTFASLLTRLDKTLLAVDAQLAKYHDHVKANWGTQFTFNGVTTTLADLAVIKFPPETEPKFNHMATRAVFALDQLVWTSVMQANYVITYMQQTDVPGDPNDPPVSWDEEMIADNPAWYATWTWQGGQIGWAASKYNIGTGVTCFTLGDMSDDACKYLFIDSADGVTINPDGLFPRATVFNDLGIPTSSGGLVVADMVKSGRTLGVLIEREGRENVERRVIERAHKDPVFRTELASRPRQTLQEFLGVWIPEHVSISVIVETPHNYGLIVPMAD